MLTLKLIGKSLGNFISVKNGMSVASHQSIMQASVAHGMSIMMNSAEVSVAFFYLSIYYSNPLTSISMLLSKLCLTFLF